MRNIRPSVAFTIGVLRAKLHELRGGNLTDQQCEDLRRHTLACQNAMAVARIEARIDGERRGLSQPVPEPLDWTELEGVISAIFVETEPCRNESEDDRSLH